MQKKIGGDRLGSGKKMNVNLHGYDRSTFNLQRIWRSTMSSGTLVPFLSELALPGDTWDIDLQADGKTHPTVGPLFGSYKMQLDIFLCPIRLYNGLLHNNQLGIGMNIEQVKFPIIQMTALQQIDVPEDLTNTQINPSCLLHYLGLKGVGLNLDAATATRQFNAIPILSYWEIYKNYYANKSEKIGAVLHTPSEDIITTVDSIEISQFPYTSEIALVQSPLTDSLPLMNGSKMLINWTPPAQAPKPEQIIIDTVEHGQLTMFDLCGGFTQTAPGELTGVYNSTRYGNSTALNWRYKTADDINTGKPAIATFPLDNIDEMRTYLMQNSAPGVAVDINTENIEPYIWLIEQPNDIPNVLSSQEGLALKTYQSDIFNNWLDTDWIDQVNMTTRVDTSAGYLELDALNIAKKVYDYMNRVAISGGSYHDWLEVTYDTEAYQLCDSPMYMGGLSKELIFQEVVSNTESESGQPLGTLAGKGVMSNKHKGGKVVIKVSEPSYIIGIISLTPRVDYSQGNKWDLHLKSLDEIHKPAMDQIGFQELITEQMAWWSTNWDNTASEWVTRSAGKQPAWLNYMTAINEVHGNFAIDAGSNSGTGGGEMFMTLNRRYEWENDDVAGVKIKDLTTYIDPSKYNFIFAETQLDAQNFWVQIAIDIDCRRKMSSKLMPNV